MKMAKRFQRIYDLISAMIMIFSYLLLDNALTIYFQNRVPEGLQSDFILAGIDLIYLLLFSILIVNLVKPQISSRFLWVLTISFITLYLLLRVFEIDIYFLLIIVFFIAMLIFTINRTRYLNIRKKS
jgi:hypothetical protein